MRYDDFCQGHGIPSGHGHQLHKIKVTSGLVLIEKNKKTFEIILMFGDFYHLALSDLFL